MNIPDYILKNDIEWHKNVDKIQFDDVLLFTTKDGVDIYHGDEYWTFPDERKDNANMVIANKKFAYGDAKPRFKTREAVQEAMKVYEWLNN